MRVLEAGHVYEVQNVDGDGKGVKDIDLAGRR